MKLPYRTASMAEPAMRYKDSNVRLLEKHVDGIHILDFRVDNGIHRRQPLAIEHECDGL
jgi:hypothetical protein